MIIQNFVLLNISVLPSILFNGRESSINKSLGGSIYPG
jgi:hypothetical protein